MDGLILANSRDSNKGKIYEEIVKRYNDYDRLRAENAELVGVLELLLTRWEHMQMSHGWSQRMGESGNGGLWASQLLDKVMRNARAAIARAEQA